MSWQDVLKRELGKNLQADIFEYLKFNPKSTVNNIHKGLKKRGLTSKRLKLFLDKHPNIKSDETLSKHVGSKGLGIKQELYSLK